MWEEVNFWKKQRYQLYNLCTNTSEEFIEHHAKVVEKEIATHSSILAWEILCTGKPDRLQPMESQSVEYDLTTKPPPCWDSE